jgi:hypothetical protein
LAFQVFVSYASRDDVAPPGGGDGFVTTFVRYLKFDLDQRKPTPAIWRDKDGKIKPSDQFDEVIRDGINRSDVLLVVFSDNWMASDYCRDELALFAAKYGEAPAKKRIIVAAKHEMDPKHRPPLLAGQTAYKFYDDVDPEKPEFFLRKKLESIDLRIQEIANDIRERLLTEDPTRDREGSAPLLSRGRKIYLAKPAHDMTAEYRRLAEELQRREYVVLPDKDAPFPLDSMAAATQFVDESLADAELSVHVLGEKFGLPPDEPGATPMVRLQLERARARVGENGFRRIVWAPKRLGDGPDRDPLEVLARFDSMVESDKIVGTEISEFTDFLVQHLAERRLGGDEDGISVIDPHSNVYVYYRIEDEDYGLAVAGALKARQIAPSLPIFDGTDVEIDAWHKRQLQECDAIVVCWANAGEVWVSQQTPEWRDWVKLGRAKSFSCRGIIAGPPGERKRSYMKKYNMHLLPANEVDIVLDLSDHETLTPEALDPLVRRAIGS